MDQPHAQLLAQSLLTNDKWRHFVDTFNIDPLTGGYFSGATFELTAFCTLKCPMCYVRIDKERAEALGGRPCTAREWIDLARQFRDQGGVFLLLTGGEPMMRPDFAEIYEEISNLGLFVSLFTNGTTVDDSILALLKRRPPAMVGLTLYGASEATYKKFGGSDGSFQRAFDGLDRLLTIPNLKIDVRFTACSENYRDLSDVHDLVASRNRLISVDFGSLAPTRGACSDTRKQRMTKDQLDEINDVIQRISQPVLDEYYNLTGDIYAAGGDAADEEKDHESRNMWCRGGKTVVFIAWDGRMYPCSMANFPYTFPLEQGFKDAALDIRRQVGAMLLPERCLTCANSDLNCSCIPKAQNEMRDCARSGEKCDYIPKDSMNSA